MNCSEDDGRLWVANLNEESTAVDQRVVLG